VKDESFSSSTQTSTSVEQVTLRFSGEGDGEEELSWGQREIWHSMCLQDSALPISAVLPIPGMTLHQISAHVRYLMARFQSMRTKIILSCPGSPKQVLFNAGEFTMEVFDTHGVDPEHVAFDVEAQWRAKPYNYEQDWPLRIALIRHGEQLSHAVVVAHHLAADGQAMRIMMRETFALKGTPPNGQQPLALARWQRSPDGILQSDAALEYWDQVLRSIPDRRFRLEPDPKHPRAWTGVFRSRALFDSVHTIAGRTGTYSSQVLLALYAVALARHLGTHPVMIRPIVSNRFRRGLRDVVGMVAQSGICELDVANITMDEAVERAGKAALLAYRHAYLDPDGLRALIARVSAERGPGFDVSSYFNDRRVSNRDLPVVPSSAIQVRPTTEFEWVRRQHNVIEHLFISFDDAPDTMQITMDIDTHVVSAADARELLYGIEAAGIKAAADGSAPTAVRSVTMNPSPRA
jgi:hypothetical protein